MKVSARGANEYAQAARLIPSPGIWYVGILRLGATYAGVLIFAVVASQAQTMTHKSGPITQHSTGRKTFETSCAPCHGLNGKGGEHAPDIATSPEIMRLSDSGILTIVREGKPQAGMPPFAGLDPAKLSDLLNYLRLLQGKSNTAMVFADAEKGEEIFSGKGGCSECHIVRGTGGFLGPDLSDYGAGHSAEDIRSAIVSAEKRPGVHKGFAKATTKDGRQISGLLRNEDNLSVQLQAQDGAFYSFEKSDLAELKFDPEPLMSDSYGAKLSKADLDQLVAYLLKVANKR